MKKMLLVKWSKSESCAYYVDLDKYSKATDHESYVSLDSFSGTYKFDKATKEVTLETGVETRTVSVLDWNLYVEET